MAIRNDSFIDYVLLAVYISPTRKYREELREYMRKLGVCITSPWLLIGDSIRFFPQQKKFGRGKGGGGGGKEDI